MKIIASIINDSLTEEMLESGQKVGAAHTPEARLEGVVLTDLDQRRLQGRVRILRSEPYREEEPALAADAQVIAGASSAPAQEFVQAEQRGQPPMAEAVESTATTPRRDRPAEKPKSVKEANS